MVRLEVTDDEADVIMDALRLLRDGVRESAPARGLSNATAEHVRDLATNLLDYVANTRTGAH